MIYFLLFYLKDGKLWDKARLTPNQRCFYVTNLSEYIIPQEKQIDVVSKIHIK